MIINGVLRYVECGPADGQQTAAHTKPSGKVWQQISDLDQAGFILNLHIT